MVNKNARVFTGIMGGPMGTALKGRTVGIVGLDVSWEEPPDPTDDIFKYNITATPHPYGEYQLQITSKWPLFFE